MNNLSLGEAMPKNKSHSYPQDKMEPGQLANFIINRIIEYPEVDLLDISSELQRSLKHVRKVYKQILDNPKFYAAVGGHDYKLLMKIFWKRANKITTKTFEFEWRGKANWPAKKVATRGTKSNTAILAYRGQFEKEI